MKSEELLETLKLLANPLNLDILILLGTRSSYPRELARILGRDETLVSRRLRILEKAGLVRARWVRLPSGKNVRIYEVAVPELRISFKPGGETRTSRGDMLAEALRMRLPDPRIIVGREKEKKALAEASENIVVIWGLPGIGKTTLAAWLARNTGPPVYWHSCSEVDDPEYISWRVSLFLASLGARDPLSYISTPGYSLRTLIDIIARYADELGAMLVFDDYQAVEHTSTGAFIRRLAESLASSRVVLVSRTRPGKLPYHEGRVLEIRLDTLSIREAEELLEAHGMHLDPREMAQVYAATTGHPLALKLYITSRKAGKATDTAVIHSRIIEYLWRELVNGFSEKQKKIIATLAPFTEPQPASLIGMLAGLRSPEPHLLELADQGVVERYGDHYRLHGLLRTLVDRSQWPETYRSTARYYYSQGGWQGLLHAMKYLLKAGDASEAARLVCERIERDEYGYVFSLDAYEQVLDAMLAKPIPGPPRACVLHDKALTLRSRGMLDEAMNLFEEALKEAEKPRIKASILQRMGFILSEKSRYEEAEEKLREALRLYEEHGLDDPLLLYGIYADLAKLAAEAGRLREAEGFLEKEIEIAEDIEDYFYRAMAVIHLANVYLWEGRLLEASRLLEPLRLELETYGNTFLLAWALLVLSETYLDLHRYRDALAASEGSLRLLGSMGFELRRADILLLRSRALLGLGRIEEAGESLAEALRCACRASNIWLLKRAVKVIEEACMSGVLRGKMIEELLDALPQCTSRKETAWVENAMKEACRPAFDHR